MDTRKELLPNTKLSFPGMRCNIEAEVGRGSNAIVYRATYPDMLNEGGLHTVLIKELFPYHQKNVIYRGSDSAIICTEEGREIWERHQRSFENGNRIHLRMLRRHPEMTGANVNSFARNGTLYTVLGYTGGRSFSTELNAPETDIRRLTVRMLMLLDALEDFHEEGYLHLDIAPDNILLIDHGSHESVVLIDYNSVHEIGALAQAPAETFSVKAGYTAPEIRAGNLAQIKEASDLYSVVAVFYHCLAGSALTPFQMIRPVPPDVSSCAALRGKPATVLAMVRQILYRGLQSMPGRRYAAIPELKQAFQELLDRIDGVGITHWALWEAARKNMLRAFRDNPAYQYIQDEKELFPASVSLPDGSRLSVETYVERLLNNDASACVIGPGGMGKTTALLRTVYLRSQSYSAGESAVAYLPLYGFAEHDTNYISNQLLSDLHFKEDTQNYEAARHRLWQLLDKHLQTRKGERPVLLLLLDGLNEVSCPTTNLLDEIRSLSRLRGVRILLSSRIAVSDLSFETAEVSALPEEEVLRQLSHNKLLLPESEEMRKLLQTPLMLSLFLRTSAAEGKQLAFRTQEELIAAYFEAIQNKALRDLPEDDPGRWQVEAAVSLVLPALAELLQNKPDAAGEELLHKTARCYRLLSGRILLRAFPRWIGHSRDIYGSAANAEAWYGVIVHGLLWKRLGLLLRTETGGYQIPHEILRDYLARKHWADFGRLQKQRYIRLFSFSLAILLIFGLFGAVYMRYIRPQPYDDSYVELVLANGLNAYVSAGHQYENLMELLQCAEMTPDRFTSALASYENKSENASDTSPLSSILPENLLQQTLDSGSYVSWSGESLDAEHYPSLLALTEERENDYLFFAAVLTAAMEDGVGLGNDDLVEYTKALGTLLEADADITAVLYQLVCEPHVTEHYLQETEVGKAFGKVHAEVVLQNKHLRSNTSRAELLRSLADLYGARDDAWADLYRCAAIGRYQRSKGDNM